MVEGPANIKFPLVDLLGEMYFYYPLLHYFDHSNIFLYEFHIFSHHRFINDMVIQSIGFGLFKIFNENVVFIPIINFPP